MNLDLDMHDIDKMKYIIRIFVKTEYYGLSCTALILEYSRKIMYLLIASNFFSSCISSLSVFFIMIRDAMFQDY